MKTLVIPDIHSPSKENLAILDSVVKGNRVIFLGDYFDHFGPDEQDTKDTAEWIQDNYKNPDYTFLLGNHDVQYLDRPPEHPKDFNYYEVSGYSVAKHKIIRSTFNTRDFTEHAKFGVYEQDWLLTHAGLSKGFWSSWRPHRKPYAIESIMRFLDLAKRDLFDVRMSGPSPKLCSRFDSATVRRYGSMIWNRPDEFRDVGKIKQIFGHTPHEDWKPLGNSLCIDTNPGFGNLPCYYMELENGTPIKHKFYNEDN